MNERSSQRGARRTHEAFGESEGAAAPATDNLRRLHDSEFSALDHESEADRTRHVDDPFVVAYELMFEMAEMLISRTGYLRQELVGFDFEGGTPVPARAVNVEQSDVLSRLMQQMLDRWPVVAHIFQGWSLPDASSSGYQHVRHEIIVIALHTRESACVATCRVDRSGHRSGSTDEGRDDCAGVKLERGALRAVPKVGDGLR